MFGFTMTIFILGTLILVVNLIRFYLLRKKGVDININSLMTLIGGYFILSVSAMILIFNRSVVERHFQNATNNIGLNDIDLSFLLNPLYLLFLLLIFILFSFLGNFSSNK